MSAIGAVSGRWASPNFSYRDEATQVGESCKLKRPELQNKMLTEETEASSGGQEESVTPHQNPPVTV